MYFSLESSGFLLGIEAFGELLLIQEKVENLCRSLVVLEAS